MSMTLLEWNCYNTWDYNLFTWASINSDMDPMTSKSYYVSIWSWSKDHWTFFLALPLFFYPKIELIYNLYNLNSSFSKLNTKDKVNCLFMVQQVILIAYTKILLDMLSSFSNQGVNVISNSYFNTQLLLDQLF